MLYWLFQDYFSHAGMGFRLVAAGGWSFILVILLGPKMIRFLIRKKIGDKPEFDHADINELTRHKSNTPTMGGVLIVISILTSLLLFGNLTNMYVKSGLFALVWLGALGGIDDWLKLRRASGEGSRDGLRTWEKFAFQIALSVLLSSFVWRHGSACYYVADTGQAINPAHSLFLPFGIAPISLPFAVYAIIMTLVMTGSSNAVNLTDGQDGLAAGCMVQIAAVLLLVSWIVGVETWSGFFDVPFVASASEMTILCAAMLGACLGFLWYNTHPAAVFMGDTGSLPLGGLIGYIAVVTRQEVLLLIASGVLVMEAGSVMIQVGVYKATKDKNGLNGKRVFRIAPIHHHFHAGGWAEQKVVVRFWILGTLFAALALGTLKLR